MTKKIALFDMDDTLCDYRGQLKRDLARKFPEENVEDVEIFQERLPRKIHNAINEIRSQKGWWLNLPYLESGLQLWQAMRCFGFETHLLTKGPYNDTNGWKEKLEWQKLFLPEAENVTITLDKKFTRGDIIIDDWSPYIRSWLNNNPSGKSITIEQQYNLNKLKTKRNFYYNGKNLQDLERFLKKSRLI